MITRLQLKRFTSFENIDISFSQGINIFTGKNSTGKTHLMKVLYSACVVTSDEDPSSFRRKLIEYFAPLNNKINRLVQRKVGNDTATITIFRQHIGGDIALRSTITTRNKVVTTNAKRWAEKHIEATYIPVKDMLANGATFVAMAESRIISLEAVYTDIIKKALIPTIKGKKDDRRKKLLSILQRELSGYVVEKNGDFFLKNKSYNLEFSLLAEGYRKLGLLWTLIQNGSLTAGSVLFWDEPEANLNPTLAKVVAAILLELQRQDVQVFIATHNYVFLKELELLATQEDRLTYFSLYKDDTDQINYFKTDEFSELTPNAIDEAYADLISVQINREMGGLGK